MPNLFAYIVLFTWPFICLVLFRRLSTSKALLITYLGGWLLLPVNTYVDLPLLPSLDKSSVTSFTAIIGCYLIKGHEFRLLPDDRSSRLLIYLWLAIPLINYPTNTEAVFNGVYWVQALTVHDVLSGVINQYITVIPFILALQFLKSYDEQILLLKFFFIATLIYCLPILFEIRMSPQLHNWFYGFFPHTFDQSMRQGGFRAVVFLGHGLTVGILLMIAIVYATILNKEKIQTIRGIPPLIPIIMLFSTLFLQKSLAPLIFTIVMVSILVLMNARNIMRLSLFIFTISITYQLLAISQSIPYDSMINLFYNYDINRAQSLAFRFQNELELVDHANQKFIGGWGAWGRNLPAQTVVDGFWILTYGSKGILGLVCVFGLIYLGLRSGLSIVSDLGTKHEKYIFSSLTLLLSFIALDQLINSSLGHSVIWLIVGATIAYKNSVILRNSLKATSHKA